MFIGKQLLNAAFFPPISFFHISASLPRSASRQVFHHSQPGYLSAVLGIFHFCLLVMILICSSLV